MTCAMRKAAVKGVLAALCACALPALAAETVLYRWTDAAGGTHYGDHPPKDARNLTRVEVDPASATVPATPRGAEPARAPVPQPGAKDILTQRRETRDRLEANLAAAREKLDLARKNLAEANDMTPSEQQTVMSKVQDVPAPPNATPNPTIDPGNMQLAGGGQFGMSQRRANCFTVVGNSGKAGVICPTIIPNQAYRERMAALEDAVKKAEEDVAAAEAAYRRGVD
jgi:hypothetical protein